MLFSPKLENPTSTTGELMPNVTWSYSSLTLFQQCPRKYFHIRVAKDFKEPPYEHRNYGNEMHRAAELYILEDAPLPPGFAFMQEVLDKLKAYPGEKYCEMKVGLTRSLEPCKFFANDVWWRGAADLLIVNGTEGRVIDYKTGKDKYADTKQLEILALALFKHFPKLEVIRAGLLFVIHTNFIKETYQKDNEAKLWQNWLPETNRLEMAHEKDVWNAKPNFTCSKYCPVLTCLHNGRT